MDQFLTIGLTGDVMLGRTLDQIIDRKGFEYPWGNVLPLLRKADVNIINLETTLTESKQKEHKTFNFKAAPEKVQSLLTANITVANLANNHTLDFGHLGMKETIRTLDRAGIKHTGAGKNAHEAKSPALTESHGLTIGVLGITDNEPGWEAGTKPGTYYVDLEKRSEHKKLLPEIHALRERADIVIVSVHWGPNMRERPADEYVDFAHLLARNGVDIVHGHSAHILQGIEYADHCLILYDTGDFVDDYVVDPVLRNDLAAYFEVSADDSGLRDLRIVPTRISEYQVNIAEGEERDWVIQRLSQLSAPWQTRIDADGTIAFRSHHEHPLISE